MTPDDPTQYRLPAGARPEAYRLRLEPDLDAASFSGTVAIDVRLDGMHDEMVLNAADLEILDAIAVLADGTERRANPVIDAAQERVALRFAAPVPAGALELRLEFRGVLNDDLRGFYRSTFADSDGDEHTIATSQLALTDARRAFPCFDEPALKATFEVTLVAPAGMAAFSNSRAVSEIVLPDGRREVAFAPTMKMSSYLVAFIVGPFEATDPLDVDGVPVRVVYPRGKGHLAAFALEVGAAALRFYVEYFDLPYPGDKVDLVAIPDFSFGAMENLGCITFRETVLLIDPRAASTLELESVAMTVAHELAHMWFGDLVTMAWWEGIWLNEAFATFLQYHCVDALHPEWQVWIRFTAACEAGLSVDALHSTRPIEYPVVSPADAMGMIDTITYEKGGSVLRMLEQFLGPDTYRDGIRRYLRRHAYANTVTADLWASLEEVSGQPVGEIMNSWILQGGHPVVSSSGGVLTQSPFQFGPPQGDSNIGSSWRIPVHSRPLRGGETVVQLLGGEPELLATAHPAIVNAGGSGVFRTNYDSAELEEIAGELGSLSEIERAVLLADTQALALAGERSVHDVLVLAEGLGTAVEPAAWDTVEGFFDILDRFVAAGDRSGFRERARSLFSPVLDELGWDVVDGEDERATHVRATAVRCLGRYGEDGAVRAEAAARFDAGNLTGDLAGSVIAVVAAMARPGDRDEMVARLHAAGDPQSEERYRVGIAAIADAPTALSTFEGCFDLFRSQDAPFVIAELTANRVGGRGVWEAMATSWEDVLARVPSMMQSVLAIGVRTFLDDRAFAERVAAFHRDHPIETGQRRVEQAIERMLTGVAFAERAGPALRDALG